LRSAGSVTLFGLDEEHLPDQIDISRWYTPAHWGADAATLAARKKGVELLPYERHFRDDVTELISRLSHQYLPVTVSGDIEYTVNRAKDSWIIGLINNEGVTKERMTPVKLDPSKKRTITVSLKRGVAKSASEWCLERELEIHQNSVTVEIPPGEVRIVEFQL